MSQNQKVSIIILNWNKTADTLECIRSLNNIDYDNFDITLIDNGSGEDSKYAIQREFPNYNYIYNEENIGFAQGVNQGIRAALQKNPDYILLLNNDTAVEKNFLSELINEAERNNDVGILGPKILFYNQKNKIWFAGGKFRKFVGMPYHIGENNIDRPEFNRKREVEYITGCCFLAKTKVFKDVGFFDPDYFNYCEDADFCKRATSFNFKILYVPSSVVYHKLSLTKGRYSPFSIYYKTRNPLIFAEKNKAFCIPFFIWYVSSIAKKLSGTLVTLNFSGFIAVLKGIFDFIRHNWGKGSMQ